MSDTTDTESSGPGTKSLLGIAAVACVACCIGPIVAVLGTIAALGLVSTIFIGAAGLLVAAVAVAAFIVVRRRRRPDASCAVVADQVPVALTRQSSEPR